MCVDFGNPLRLWKGCLEGRLKDGSIGTMPSLYLRFHVVASPFATDVIKISNAKFFTLFTFVR